MMHNDEVEDSPLSQSYFYKCFTYAIEVYRGKDKKEWILEVATPDDNSFVWDETFPSDSEALTFAIKTIHEDEALQPEYDFDEEAPLTYSEQLDLDRFLATRFTDEQLDDEHDFGVISLSILDGYLTAMVTRPELIESSWLRSDIWGEFKPKMDEFTEKRVYSLIRRHNNEISHTLVNAPDSYQPIFSEYEESIFSVDVDEWCAGYCRVMEHHQAKWIHDGKGVRDELLLIALFGTTDGLVDLVTLEKDEIQERIDQLPQAIKSIHRYFYQQRTDEMEPPDDAALDMTPLSHDELLRVDQLLQMRIPDDAGADNDEGIIDCSELDGYLTAILSAKEPIMAQVWLDGLWGEYSPLHETIEELTGLIIRHYNSLTGMFIDEGDFFPLFHINKTPQGESIEVVEEWCYGYVRAMKLAPDLFALDEDEEDELFDEYFDILQLFGADERLDELMDLSRGMVKVKQEAVPLAIEYIFHKMRGAEIQYSGTEIPPVAAQYDEPMPTFVRDTPKVGRNDPCPCGSGKKFKKCCLH